MHIPVLKNRSKMIENVDANLKQKRDMNGPGCHAFVSNSTWVDQDVSRFFETITKHFQIQKIWFWPPQQYDFVWIRSEMWYLIKAWIWTNLPVTQRGVVSQSNYHCPFKPPFLSKNRPHFQSFLIDFLAPGYALSFDVFKITLLTGRGYPPLFYKMKKPPC